MTVSELIAALQAALVEHGDIEAGFYASPGAGSWSPVDRLESFDVNEWATNLGKESPRYVPRVVVNLGNAGD